VEVSVTRKSAFKVEVRGEARGVNTADDYAEALRALFAEGLPGDAAGIHGVDGGKALVFMRFEDRTDDLMQLMGALDLYLKDAISWLEDPDSHWQSDNATSLRQRITQVTGWSWPQ
jgi:hypothetical protein